jgi:3-oxoacyl-[acyl-carrier protein] reductase
VDASSRYPLMDRGKESIMAEQSSGKTGFDVKTALSVAGRVVVVTGGGRGIGKIYSQRLAEGGAKIVVADIVEKESEEVAEAIRKAGGEAIAAPTDVTDPERTQQMADAALKAFGRIDGLINNASLMSALPRQSWMKIPLDEWDRVMAVNLRGIFLACRAVYPAMQRQKFGRIINISSSRFWTGQPNRLHYTTSKAGVIGLTRALAREVGEDNIAVNAITPGMTMSETQVATTSSNYSAGRGERRVFKRDEVPDDLVGTVMFLLSDASGFITGQTFNVDGGESMH